SAATRSVAEEGAGRGHRARAGYAVRSVPLAGRPLHRARGAGDPRHVGGVGANARTGGRPFDGAREMTTVEAYADLRRFGRPVITTEDAALRLGATLSAATRILARLAKAGLLLKLR